MQGFKKDVMPVVVTANTTCGLDIHKDKIDACIRINDGTLDGVIYEKSFNAARGALLELRDWILSFNCFKVLMESTGVYWMPIFFLLGEIAGMDVGLGNSRHTKNTPGRPKSDKEDARWLSRLCMLGYLPKSYIVPKPFRNLREYTRYHKKLVQERARHKNRIEKLLQMNGFKLSSVLTGITGVSGPRILSLLCEQGSLTLEDVSLAIDKRVKAAPEEIAYAINGVMKPTSRTLLKKQLAKLARSDKEVDDIYGHMVEPSKTYSRAIEIISSIPGLPELSAIYIIAETGVGMSSFKTSGHLASWAGLAPKGDQSADKESPKKTKKANQYVKTILVECARAAANARSSRTSMWYWGKVNGMGEKKATIAVARKLLCYIYTMLKNDTLYDASLDRAYEKNINAKKLDPARKIVDSNPRHSGVNKNSSSLLEKVNNVSNRPQSGPELNDSVATPKKRGRPKKNIASTDGKTPNSEDNKQDTDVSAPKKRGRPKKNIVAPTDGKASDAEDSQPVSSSENEPTTGILAPRKRGRPRKKQALTEDSESLIKC